ncbi:BatA domain-containing protein, partial [Roseibium sp.]
MFAGLPLTFTAPWILTALALLPVIWWLLRLTPPRPREIRFPPTRLLIGIDQHEETPQRSPWWLTLLRLLMAAILIIALAGP